jgi:putative tryptophan/tyrosine transport system substrate-binding protein
MTRSPSSFTMLLSRHTRRREFIAALGGAVAWPLIGRAQQPLPVIGYLDPGTTEGRAPLFGAFLNGLKEVGFVDGKNLTIEYRAAEDHYDRAPAMVADLVKRQVNLIVAISLPMALATKAVVTTIPVVFGMGDDPVKFGLVASLNRPGANVTGISMLSPTIEAKRVELLHEFAPKATRIAALVNPKFPGFEVRLTAVRDAANKLGLQLNIYNVSDESDIDPAFAAMIEHRTDALIITTAPIFSRHKERLVELAERHALPAVYFSREFALAGGLMSYGSSFPDAYRQTGVYAGRVLKGEKPSELPILQPTKFDLVINLKSAKALGLDAPMALIAAADEVIE